MRRRPHCSSWLAHPRPSLLNFRGRARPHGLQHTWNTTLYNNAYCGLTAHYHDTPPARTRLQVHHIHHIFIPIVILYDLCSRQTHCVIYVIIFVRYDLFSSLSCSSDLRDHNFFQRLSAANGIFSYTTQVQYSGSKHYISPYLPTVSK